jgi:hypothetical protein
MLQSPNCWFGRRCPNLVYDSAAIAEATLIVTPIAMPSPEGDAGEVIRIHNGIQEFNVPIMMGARRHPDQHLASIRGAN